MFTTQLIFTGRTEAAVNYEVQIHTCCMSCFKPLGVRLVKANEHEEGPAAKNDFVLKR